MADAQTGNVPVRILVDNSENALAIGETLHAAIVVGQSAATLAVPLAAVHDEGEGPVVTVVRENKSVVLHPQYGEADSGWVAVTGSDLKVGEPVIVEGAYNLPDGTPVMTDTEGSDAPAAADETSRRGASVDED